MPSAAPLAVLGLASAAAATAVVGIDAHGGVSADQRYKAANVTALRAALLDGYEKFEQPPVTGEAPERGVKVAVQLALNQITSIDVSEQSIGFYGWWRHNWEDPRLAWDPDDWGGVTELSFVATGLSREVWMPDDTIYDATETDYLLPDMLVNVYPGGGVWVSLPIASEVPCPMKLSRFPFDIQECTFTHGSWTLNGVYVDMVPRVVDGEWRPFAFTVTYHAHTEYDVLSVETQHYDTFYGCCPEPYPVITYQFTFRRHSITYISGILMPMILSTFVGMLAFGVNPGSGERISLGITVMLTNAAIYIVAFQVLPKGSAWSALAYIHVTSFCFALATLVVSLISVSLYCVKPAHGCRESDLLYSFVEADKDGSGDIDKAELRDVVEDLGLSPTSRVSLFGALNKSASRKTLDIDEWYDVVAQIYDQTHLAAYHSWLYIRLLVPLIHRERARRKVSVLARIRAAQAEKLAALDASQDGASDPPSRATSLGAELDDAPTAASLPGDGEDSFRGELPGTAPRRVRLAEAGDSRRVRLAEAGDDYVEVPVGSERLSDRARPWRRPTLTRGESVIVASSDPLADTGDVTDPTEYVARKLAGQIDFIMSLSIPISYIIIVCIVLRPFDEDEGVFQEDFKCTTLSHIHDGVRAWTDRC